MLEFFDKVLKDLKKVEFKFRVDNFDHILTKLEYVDN